MSCLCPRNRIRCSTRASFTRRRSASARQPSSAKSGSPTTRNCPGAPVRSRPIAASTNVSCPLPSPMRPTIPTAGSSAPSPSSRRNGSRGTAGPNSRVSTALRIVTDFAHPRLPRNRARIAPALQMIRVGSQASMRSTSRIPPWRRLRACQTTGTPVRRPATPAQTFVWGPLACTRSTRWARISARTRSAETASLGRSRSRPNSRGRTGTPSRASALGNGPRAGPAKSGLTRPRSRWRRSSRRLASAPLS